MRWQVYTALLAYVPLRFMVHLSDWVHSFARLFAVARSALWESINLLALLKSYGTTSGRNLNGYRPYRKKSQSAFL